MANVLVIAPHADDEVLGCGGVIAKHRAQGHNVYVAIMTNAALGAPELFKQEQIDEVRAEAKKAHQLLDVTETFYYDMPAPQLEQYPNYKIASTLNQLIREIQAHIVYVPHKGDLHLDHGAIYNAALVATRPVPGQTVKHVFAYETLSETEWGHPSTDAVFIANKFVDISGAFLSKKLAAMSCFSSQLKPFPNSRSLQALEHQARLRGATVGVMAAEAFSVLRTID